MSISYRRCFHLSETGQQCETWFPAVDSNKLCPSHRDSFNGVRPSKKTEESKVRYIDLVNDERTYCYHFLDGTAQNQDQKLIHEFVDDSDGSIFEKLDRHIAFLEKVIEDLKARHSSARAVRAEKLDSLSEEERKKLREHKIDRAVKSSEGKTRAPSFTKDPIGHLMKARGLSQAAATEMLDMDEDELLEKYRKAKEMKERGE